MKIESRLNPMGGFGRRLTQEESFVLGVGVVLRVGVGVGVGVEFEKELH